MRINVYAEELTYDAKFITKLVDGRRFYGIRMFLKSAPELHHTPGDDDRSAITFWVPWHHNRNHHGVLQDIFRNIFNVAKGAEQNDTLESLPEPSEP